MVAMSNVMSCNAIPAGRLHDIVYLLAEHTLPLVENFYTPEKPGRGSCVLIAHIVRDVLHRFGYLDAACLPCVVEAYNALASEYLEKSKALPPHEQTKLAHEYKQRGGHILIVGDPNDSDGDGGWPGHLVCVVAGHLLDLTMGQFSRPQKQLELGPVAVPLMQPGPWPELSRVTALGRPDGATVTWYATPSNQRYQTGRAAQPETRALVVDLLERRIRKSSRRPHDSFEERKRTHG